LDLDAVCDGEWGRSRDESITRDPHAPRGGWFRVCRPHWFQWRTFSASLSINTIERKRYSSIDLLPRPPVGLCVCLFVCPESVLWQNGCLNPDAIWGGDWGRSRDGSTR